MRAPRRPNAYDHPPVLVVGAGLAGMAAAARLAKAGHPVEVYETRTRPGGLWAPRDVDDILVDDAPAVIGFPAPWRDLFKKSGRAMEAELTRAGLELIPAAPAVHRFADGSELTLPTDRGDQHAAIAETYGRPAAERWQALVDHLDDVWQTVRPLGLESELRHKRQLDRRTRTLLSPRVSIESLARRIDEPHLAQLIRGVAHRLGASPRRTPAFCAVRLSVERRFGRWTVATEDEQGRTSALIEQIAGRLQLRKVEIRFGTPVEQILLDGSGRATGLRFADGSRGEGAAVICTADPWQTYGSLLEVPPVAERRDTDRLTPALFPAVEHQVSPFDRLKDGDAGLGTGVSETITYNDQGVPTVTYARSASGRIVTSTHDYDAASPRAGAGVAWDGFRSWLRRPPIVSDVAGLYLAGPHSRGGAGLSETLLSGALASYASHDAIDAEVRAKSE